MNGPLSDKVALHLVHTRLEDVDRFRFLVLALCGEAGELANLVKKDWRGDDGDRTAAIIEELADIGNYAFMIARHLGVDLETEMVKKLEEVERRPTWQTMK